MVAGQYFKIDTNKIYYYNPETELFEELEQTLQNPQISLSGVMVENDVFNCS